MADAIHLRLRLPRADRIFGIDFVPTAIPSRDAFFALQLEDGTEVRMHPIDAYRLHAALGELLQAEVEQSFVIRVDNPLGRRNHTGENDPRVTR